MSVCRKFLAGGRTIKLARVAAKSTNLPWPMVLVVTLLFLLLLLLLLLFVGCFLKNNMMKIIMRPIDRPFVLVDSL